MYSQDLLRFFLLLGFTDTAFIWHGKQDDFTPTIGVLSQSHNETHSYIAASYIKYLESAGARLIPVPTNRDENFYENVFQNINGVLFPGGGVDLVKSEYAKLSRYFLMKSVTENADGRYFPIWGTCLGFEELLVTVSGVKEQTQLLSKCSYENVMKKITPEDGWNNSRYINSMSPDMVEFLKNSASTYNSHSYCMEKTNFEENDKLSKIFSVVGSTENFVSIIENSTLGWFGTQFHPEKAQFEFGRSGILHSPETIKLGFESARFFVEEAKKNMHRLMNKDLLIYNFITVYTGQKENHSFEEVYYFEK